MTRLHIILALMVVSGGVIDAWVPAAVRGTIRVASSAYKVYVAHKVFEAYKAYKAELATLGSDDDSTDDVDADRRKRSVENEMGDIASQYDLDVGLHVVFFDMIDSSGDGYIDVCEWTIGGDSLEEYMNALGNVDTDEDERISFDEFLDVEFDMEGNLSDMSEPLEGVEHSQTINGVRPRPAVKA